MEHPSLKKRAMAVWLFRFTLNGKSLKALMVVVVVVHRVYMMHVVPPVIMEGNDG